MRNIVPEDIEAYCTAMSDRPSPLLRELEEYTRATCPTAFMLTGPVEGALLRLLIQLSGARQALDVGTFTGYSALTMAEALPEDGHVITCEGNPTVAAIAQSFFDRSPHGGKIELRLGQAAETIDGLPQTSCLDFVFLDADKASHPSYYEALLPRLRSGGLLVADNTLLSGEVLAPEGERARAVVRFNERVAADDRVSRVVLSVRDGVTVVRRR